MSRESRSGRSTPSRRGTLENGLTYLEVIGEQGQPRIARIHVKLFVAAGYAVAARTLFEHMLMGPRQRG